MFIVALFVIAKLRNQPKCSSADEWTKKQWCIYTNEYYLALKNKKFVTYNNMD